MSLSTLFDAHYYATGCGMPYRRDERWMAIFGGFAERIIAGIGPATALDAGCAIGLLVEQLRLRGVAAEGVDISDYAIGQAHESIREHVRVGSVAEPFGQRYDLIVCIEVLEHMPQAEAERAVANFCAHTDDVLFSSSPLDYMEATHLNVQPPEHWAYLFAQQGFYRDVDFDAGFITPWAVRFRRRSEPAARVVRDYERRFWLLWKENSDLRRLAVEQRAQLAAADGAAHDRALAAGYAEQAAAEAGAYAQRLEHELANKSDHIARLEQQIRRLENGRLMRLLRLLRAK